ncbi:hypothetical protein Pan153_24230 [Gimesia panareensis]|uniref:Uncharacterized protein n=1 Tax=Gimesia panareensis TaxID=2527978 RepID=A0A518FN42_9PLAN|nr:hypothetical protein [Gimesia panareensis]QDV17768.1 hypothetical protein Pan153_24230 [Gimesia panareensis]
MQAIILAIVLTSSNNPREIRNWVGKIPGTTIQTETQWILYRKGLVKNVFLISSDFSRIRYVSSDGTVANVSLVFDKSDMPTNVIENKRSSGAFGSEFFAVVDLSNMDPIFVILRELLSDKYLKLFENTDEIQLLFSQNLAIFWENQAAGGLERKFNLRPATIVSLKEKRSLKVELTSEKSIFRWALKKWEGIPQNLEFLSIDTSIHFDAVYYISSNDPSHLKIFDSTSDKTTEYSLKTKGEIESSIEKSKRSMVITNGNEHLFNSVLSERDYRIILSLTTSPSEPLNDGWFIHPRVHCIKP